MNAVDKIIPQFTIEEGRPIPEIRSSRNARLGRPRLYPIDQMNIGACLTVPVVSGRSVRRAMQIMSAIVRRYSKKTGKKFTTRSFPAEQAIRVWRIA